MSAAPSAKAKAVATPPATADGAAAAPAKPRRVPGWLLAAAGAALTAAYGVVIEHMRFSPPLVMLALGGMTLVLAGLALWRIIDPLTRTDAPPTLAPRAPQRLRELDREKQLVLKAIKEIELDYQMRKIAEADYREMIDRYRARAMRLISELEAGDNYRLLIERELKDRLHALAEAGTAAPAAFPEHTASAEPPVIQPAPAGKPPAAAGPRCPQCATVNESDAHFCKSCGVRLAQVS